MCAAGASNGIVKNRAKSVKLFDVCIDKRSWYWYNTVEVIILVHSKRLHDLTGRRFARLIVLKKDIRMGGRKSYWECLCDCGNKKVVRGDSLVGGVVRSCGCLKKEVDIINLGIKNPHGKAKHPLYSKWNSMIQRCKNPTVISYKHYGGRGIKVCKDWEDINNFIEWGKTSGYKSNLTIDRIDVNGDYEPKNCRWIPLSEQGYNKTNSVYHVWKGEKLTTMQWVHRYNIPISKAWGYKSNGVKFTDLISEYASKTIPR